MSRSTPYRQPASIQSESLEPSAAEVRFWESVYLSCCSSNCDVQKSWADAAIRDRRAAFPGLREVELDADAAEQRIRALKLQDMEEEAEDK